jgi:hypothetical protein
MVVRHGYSWVVAARLVGRCVLSRMLILLLLVAVKLLIQRLSRFVYMWFVPRAETVTGYIDIYHFVQCHCLGQVHNLDLLHRGMLERFTKCPIVMVVVLRCYNQDATWIGMRQERRVHQRLPPHTSCCGRRRRK